MTLNIPLSFNASDLAMASHQDGILFTEPLTSQDLGELPIESLKLLTTEELGILNTLSRAGQERIRTRLLVIFAELAKRFESGEFFNGLTGQRAMASYLRSIGFDPGKLRVWRFQMRKEEISILAGENMQKVRNVPAADLDNIAATVQDVADKAPEPLGIATSPPIAIPDRNDLADENFNSADFDTAADFLKSSCLSLFTEFAVQRILSILADRPGVLAHAECLEDLASVLRSTAEGADNLAREISTTLAVALQPEI